jgi:hypothetical protein
MAGAAGGPQRPRRPTPLRLAKFLDSARGGIAERLPAIAFQHFADVLLDEALVPADSARTQLDRGRELACLYLCRGC